MSGPKTVQHEHLHLFADGLRRKVHRHAHPVNAADARATRPHRHVNGAHSHPHDHRGYEPLPNGVQRRPIVPADR